MYYDEKSGTANFMSGVVLGVILGAGIALLTAPHSGKTTRARLVRRGGRGSEVNEGASDAEMELDSASIRALKRRRRRAGR